MRGLSLGTGRQTGNDEWERSGFVIAQRSMALNEINVAGCRVSGVFLFVCFCFVGAALFVCV